MKDWIFVEFLDLGMVIYGYFGCPFQKGEITVITHTT